jgi:lysophospholipase L1-like esterase
MPGIDTFVAIGDSFTEGLNDPDPAGGFRGWADRVAAALSAQRPGFRYANLAIRGKLLGQVVAEQVSRAVELAPDLVSLAAGGNDILRGSDVDALAGQFESAVAKLQAAGCRVLIFTGFDPRMFPVIRLLRGRIAAYDMHLRGIADSYGCDLVDLWSMRALKDTRSWSPDRLHLTRAPIAGCSFIRFGDDPDTGHEIYPDVRTGHGQLTSPDVSLDSIIDLVAHAPEDIMRVIAEVRRLRG